MRNRTSDLGGSNELEVVGLGELEMGGVVYEDCTDFALV